MPPSLAAREVTSGGSWWGSPTKQKLRACRIGPREAGRVTCPASSKMHTSKMRPFSSACPMPRHVVATCIPRATHQSAMSLLVSVQHVNFHTCVLSQLLQESCRGQTLLS